MSYSETIQSSQLNTLTHTQKFRMLLNILQECVRAQMMDKSKQVKTTGEATCVEEEAGGNTKFAENTLKVRQTRTFQRQG